MSIQTQDEYGEGVLLCFDHTGRIRWNCTTGRELKFGNTIYSSDYRISGFFVHDFDSNGRSEIIIVSAHRHFYPTQLSIVGADGELIGEYWNSGRISDVEITDLNGDGKEEVVVSGCNNEYGKACLIVFDSDQVKGCSPQHPDYRCSELEDGMEKYYILFPRTEIDILESPVESIRTLEKLRNNRLSLRTTHSQIIYELDQNLILMDIRFSHAFEMKHKEALLEGRIRRTLDNEHRRLCEEGILYFNGKEWVPEPTMTNYWKN
ncbi:MAG: VCBS repeat-containing protein [Candidatus Aminicenantes bacterium]